MGYPLSLGSTRFDEPLSKFMKNGLQVRTSLTFWKILLKIRPLQTFALQILVGWQNTILHSILV